MAATQQLQSVSPLHTPQSSRGSSPRSKLTLDLSDLPPLIQPSPPSNTLLITNLDDLAIFDFKNLQIIRDTIGQHVAIHAFSPLKSFRRIVVSFYDIPSAAFIKQTLDGEVIMDCRARIFFGANTAISPTNIYLEAPKVDKLFFISPPPSPPHDWAVRNEEAPNKDVHAEDLAEALSKLHTVSHETNDTPMDINPDDFVAVPIGKRSRSATLVYHPDHHGSNPSLPAIQVEDTSALLEEDDADIELSPMEGIATAPILHTSRPPVELMH